VSGPAGRGNDRAAPAPGTWARRSRVALAHVAARPLLAALAVLVAGHAALVVVRDYQPAGDWAFIDLRTSDVFSRHPPLTGPWSRYGWNHPGPALYFALAGPMAAAAGSWRGVWLGAVVLNVAAFAVAIWLATRHGRLVVAAFASAAVWTVATATPLLWSDPWNASIVVVPIVTMAAAVMAARSGDRRGVAVGIVAFVLVTQAHVAYGVLLVPAFAVVVVCGLRRWWRWTAGWLAAGLALCVPIAVDTVANWPGNLWRSVDFAVTSGEPAVGVPEALRVVGRTASLSWFADARLPSFVSVVSTPPWGLVPFAAIAALAGAWFLARRRGFAALAHACEGTASLWVGAAIMTARTRGPLLVWLTTWTSALGALTWALAAAVVARWALWHRPVDEAGRRRRRGLATAAVAIVTVALAVTNVAGSVGHPFPFQEQTPVIAQFAADARHIVDEPTMIDFAGDDYVGGAVQSGLIAALEADGGQPRGRPDQSLQLGEHRVADQAGARHLLVHVEPRVSPPAGAEVVSVWDPLTPAERAEADALTDRLATLLAQEGLVDRVGLLSGDLAALAAIDAPPPVAAEQDAFDRLGDLHARGRRIVLYVVG
jgi:hypothetical protein